MSDLTQKIETAKANITALKLKYPNWKDSPVAEVDAAIAALKVLIADEKKQKAAAAPAKSPAAATSTSTSSSATGASDKHLLSAAFEKKTHFHEWYTDIIFKSELISNYAVSGCYVLRPWSYRMWELIQDFMNAEFRKRDVQNCYFPCFVTEDALKKEESHLDGFAAEVAWITKSGKSELAKRIAIRPTSETVMYPVFSEWIRSHRELPMKLNQWCNVVRWEFKNPTPFLRTREFLWQEGHTVHATAESAKTEVYDILDVYARTYSELLAVPMIKGTKTESEKFAGGDYTTTVEGYIPYAGKGIQAATSHGLGQNFGKIFDISFEGTDGKQHIPYQNSWGFTTRSLGIVVMVHGDDDGLVLPPRVAPIQAIVIPIFFKDADNAALEQACDAVTAELKAAGLRAQSDTSDLHTPGFKRSHWELKGVPLRIEIGPKDMASNSVLMCVRDVRTKRSIPRASLVADIKVELDTMHARMLAKATKQRDENIEQVSKFEDFVPALNRQKLVLAPFCNTGECEKDIKDTQKKMANEAEVEVVKEGDEEFQKVTAAAKALCIPLDQGTPSLQDNVIPCFKCGKRAVVRCLFGRSF